MTRAAFEAGYIAAYIALTGQPCTGGVPEAAWRLYEEWEAGQGGEDAPARVAVLEAALRGLIEAVTYNRDWDLLWQDVRAARAALQEEK